MTPREDPAVHPDEASERRATPNADAVPDADHASRAEDLLPEPPPENAPATGDPDKKSALGAPVPAHGALASTEQLDEGGEAEALEEQEDPSGTEARRDDRDSRP